MSDYKVKVVVTTNTQQGTITEEFKLTVDEWQSTNWKDALSLQRVCKASGLACLCGRCVGSTKKIKWKINRQ